MDGSQAVCCHSDCLGGCSLANSAQHCHACRHVRLKDGTCAEKCPPGLFEVSISYQKKAGFSSFSLKLWCADLLLRVCV